MAHCRHCNRCMIRHLRCKGSCRVPGTDHSHSDHPSAETQRDKTDTDCHRCTRLRRNHHKHSRHRSAACLHHTPCTKHLQQIRSWLLSLHKRHTQLRPSQQMVVFHPNSQRTHDRPTSTDPRKHRSPCAACSAPDQPHIGRMGSHQRCTRTSPSVTGMTRMQSLRHSADCQRHIAHTHLLPQTRKHCPQQSMADIQCDW